MLDAGNLWGLVEARAAATPDDIMAVDQDGRELTFGQYRDQAEVMAAGFAAMGIGEGDVVSWQLPTWLETLVLVAALSRLGATQNPMLPIYREKEVGFVTRQAGTKLLIVPGTWRGYDYTAMGEALAAAQPGLSVLDAADRRLPSGDPATLPPPPATPASADDLPVRWYYYTSGTTADPKGAQHTDATIWAAARGMCQALEVRPDDRIGCVFPFTHVAGAVYVFSALAYGCRMLIVEAFDAEATPPILRAGGVTLAGAGTPFHQAYVAYQRAHPDEAPIFPELRALIGGGAPKPPQLHIDARDELGGIGICSGYGMTEAPIVTMAGVRDTDQQLADTEGAPVEGVDLVLVKLDGSRAEPGEEGEIRVKGPMVMRGYLDASLDAEAFDDDGYLRTGDLGRAGPEGHLAITGRVKDIIIRNMENISAKEVEDLLFSHPSVVDAAVIGLPDDRTGERVCAVVVLKPGAEPLSLADLVAHTAANGLAVQKTPEQLEVLDALPRNPTGKVLKFELRDRFGG
jgi:cyclohexanecarboxylate-CoA ligase